MPYQPFQGLKGPGGGSILDRRGNLRLVQFTGATGPVTIPVPGNVLWRLVTLSTIVAAVQNTFVFLHFLDPSGTLYAAFGAISATPGGLTIVNSFTTQTTAAQQIAGGNIGGALGESAFLLPGSSILLSWAFAVGPPTFSDGSMLVEEWVLG